MSILLNYKDFLKTLPSGPGVYQMFDSKQKVLYVGKAKDLKKRVTSYFHHYKNSARINALMTQVNNIEVILTQTENEALLLENTLIKQLKPRFNVLFRDDKSYPYIFLSEQDEFPRLDFHRGAKSQKGRYFGPYPSAFAVRESLNLLQKLFRIRQCSNNFFRNRTRPCIQYQIKRCTAPCVGYVDADSYQQQVKLAELFLEGKSQQLITEINKQMEHASQQLAFEDAANYRDQIAILKQIQERQYVTSQNIKDVDVIAVVGKDGMVCVGVLFIRAGRLIGNHTYIPQTPDEVSLAEVLTEFLPQYYLNASHRQDIPRNIVVNIMPEEADWIAESLTEKAEHKVEISHSKRGVRAQWLKMAFVNAHNALATVRANKASLYHRFESLQRTLNLDNLPQRLECFDVSHTFGEAIVASCVVFNIEGPLKQDYRRFNIEGITKGDDYAGLYQALQRRYTRVKEKEEVLPDVIIIDGGKGQLHQAEKILEELQITGVILMSIAKGAGRKSGLEKIYLSGQHEPVDIAPHSAGFHLLQQIRDEAHRFAITGHKNKRDKQRKTSILQSIPGIGPKRRQQLIKHFGGLQEIKAASIEDIAKLPGINLALAQKIYEHFRTC